MRRKFDDSQVLEAMQRIAGQSEGPRRMIRRQITKQVGNGPGLKLYGEIYQEMTGERSTLRIRLAVMRAVERLAKDAILPVYGDEANPGVYWVAPAAYKV